MGAGPLRVVLVDDHEMVLVGLEAMLARHSAAVCVVGTALDVESARTVVHDLDPDVVITDVRLGSGSGLDLCQQLVAIEPDRKIVMLTVYDEEQFLFQALRAGAAGYLLKQIDAAELIRQLERVAAGEVAIDPTMAGRTMANAARLQAGEFWPGAHRGLTQRESEVLGHMVAGMSNRAVAGRLVLSEETVRTHVRAVYRKLAVGDRAGAVSVALREGLFR